MMVQRIKSMEVHFMKTMKPVNKYDVDTHLDADAKTWYWTILNLQESGKAEVDAKLEREVRRENRQEKSLRRELDEQGLKHAQLNQEFDKLKRQLLTADAEKSQVTVTHVSQPANNSNWICDIQMMYLVEMLRSQQQETVDPENRKVTTQVILKT